MSEKGDTGIADANAAFGTGPNGKGPTLATRAAYRKEYGAAAYDDEMQKWSASKFDLKPGASPYDDATKDKRATNPWSEDFEKAQGHEAAVKERVGIIQRLGTGPAAAMARAAGRTLAGSALNK